ncbi:MAG: hypothetical protein QM784_21020 [Polyangiaceae bacterium]
MSLDVGIVRGGGYLFIDVDRGEYAGVLELSFSGIVTLTAIGLITTKMPDGSSGFSLLIIISVEFGNGIQLGFGFTLLAVGGLVGVNRTMDLQALAEGVRSGSLSSVMFPTNVIANAPRIISDLRTFFPPKQDTFLIGPMAKLGWGTPTLISVSLGIIIEIPGNIAIVGLIRVVLPTEEAALVVLQVAFIGALEFDKKRLWFFASIFDSRIVFLTIEGEMGLLVAWGDDANFVLSVGGFHPSFTPPPLPFPSPRRIAVNILKYAGRAHSYRGLLRRNVEHGTARRSRRTVLWARYPECTRAPCFRCAVSVFALLLHHRDLGVSVRECLWGRALQRAHQRFAQRSSQVERQGSRLLDDPVLGYRCRLREDLG